MAQLRYYPTIGLAMAPPLYIVLVIVALNVQPCSECRSRFSHGLLRLFSLWPRPIGGSINAGNWSRERSLSFHDISPNNLMKSYETFIDDRTDYILLPEKISKTNLIVVVL